MNQMSDIYSVTLGELIEDGIFKWENFEDTRPKIYLNWSDIAFNEEQFTRCCNSFESRFWFDEIAITPPLAWMNMLAYKIRTVVMPKYRHLYKIIEDGYNPFYDYDKVGKARDILSEFPETLLTNNQDYASSGQDKEYEEYMIGDMFKDKTKIEKFKSIDEMFINEFKPMFNIIWTNNFNTF